jgi:hypothetical protein
MFVPHASEVLLNVRLAVFEDDRHGTQSRIVIGLRLLKLLDYRACPFAYNLASTAVPVFIGKLVDTFE